MDTVVIESHPQHFTVDRIMRLVQNPRGRALATTRTKTRQVTREEGGVVGGG